MLISHRNDACRVPPPSRHIYDTVTLGAKRITGSIGERYDVIQYDTGYAPSSQILEQPNGTSVTESALSAPISVTMLTALAPPLKR